VKTIPAFILTALFAFSAHAGSVDGKHHEGKMGGCASKNKMADLTHFKDKEGYSAHATQRDEPKLSAAEEKKQLIEKSI